MSSDKRVTIQDLRTHEAAELEFQLKERRKRIFELRFKSASEEIADNKELSRLRREVARILTIQNERKRQETARKLEGSAREGAGPSAPRAHPERTPSANEGK